MKYFYSTSALLSISSFLLYSIFLFYLIAQKHSGNIIVEDIFRFNIICLMLSFLPCHLDHFKNKSKNNNEIEKSLTIFEEKQQAEERHRKLSKSPQLRRKSHLISILLGFWMSSLMMSFILMLDN